MNTNRFTLAATAVLIVGASVAVAAPAQAAPNACELGMACTYEDANYGGGHINFFQNIREYRDIGWWVPTNHPITHDSASSLFNNGTTRRWARVYEHDKYQGRYVTADMGKGVPHLGILNDLTSSACFADYCR